MATASKNPKENLSARAVKFNVKATSVVRTARAAMLKAIVDARGREADLAGLADTLEVLSDYLAKRATRDIAARKTKAVAAAKAAAAIQANLNKQREITAAHEVEQANKGLKAAKAKLAAVKA